MRYFLAIFTLCALAACAVQSSSGPRGLPGPTGAQGDTGASGVGGSTGAPGLDGSDGATGPTGADGSDGADGEDATPVTVVKLCPGTSVYPTVFLEYGICLQGQLYGVYSANGGFLALLPPGHYSSNAIGSSCSLTIGPNCQVAH